MLRRRGGPASPLAAAAICVLLALLSCGCGGERYDRDAITFSPDGSLLQVSHPKLLQASLSPASWSPSDLALWFFRWIMRRGQ